MKIIVALIALGIALGVCRAEEVKGEVFVVTGGGANVLLGRVAVRAYDLAATREEIAKRKDVAEAALAKARPAKEAAHKASEASGYSDPSHQQLFENYLDWLVVVTFFESGLFYTADFPEPKAQNKTDSAGRYALDLPPGSYAISATASRAVGDGTEVYHWLVACEVKGGKPTDLTLSNDNQTSENDPGSLVRTVTPKIEYDAQRGSEIFQKKLASLAAAAVKPAPAPAVAEAAKEIPKPARTAEESKKLALTVYPQLGVAGSPINKAFVERVRKYQSEKPEFFNDPNWPLMLAQECAGK